MPCPAANTIHPRLVFWAFDRNFVSFSKEREGGGEPGGRVHQCLWSMTGEEGSWAINCERVVEVKSVIALVFG